MAFLRANFGPLGGQSKRGSAPQMWTYKTDDALATVDTSGYFDNISDILEVGDTIRVIVPISGTPTAGGDHIVMSNAAGVVDVSDAAALTVTDSD